MKLFIIAVLATAFNAYSIPELLEAAQRGDTSEVKRLIDAGAFNAYGSPELLEAVRRGDTSEVRRLIDAGVDIDFQYYRGNTTLILEAYSRGLVDIVRVLINAGAAVHSGNSDIVQALIDFDADLDIQDRYGNTTFALCTLILHSL